MEQEVTKKFLKEATIPPLVIEGIMVSILQVFLDQGEFAHSSKCGYFDTVPPLAFSFFAFLQDRYFCEQFYIYY